MRNILIAFILFISVFASAQNRVGLVHPRVLGQPTDTTQFGVLLMDTVTKAGEWFNLNTTDFQVSGGELGLRNQTDSVFVIGDSLCAITNGDTLCVFQDSVYVTSDSFCIIQMGDTTCVEFTGGFGTTLYTGDDTITSNRILTVPTATTMLFRRADSGGTSDIFKIESSATATNSLTLGLNSSATNKAVVTLRNVAGAGNIYQKFENAVLTNYNIGIDRASGLFNITEGGFIHTGQFMQFSSAGDSVIVNRDIQFDAGVLDGGGDLGTSGQVLTSTGAGVNWETPTSSGIAISDLTPADTTNTINNDAYRQEWQWDGLAGNTALKLSSTNTSASGGNQKLFEVALTGINGTPSQETYAAHVSNTHSGTTSTNYGLRAIATGGTINYGVYSSVTGTSAFSSAVYGTSTSIGNAISGVASSGYGVYGTSAGSSAIYGLATSTNLAFHGVKAEKNNGNTNSLDAPLGVYCYSTGTPANGFGATFPFYLEPATGSTALFANAFESEWTDATTASRGSRATITGVSSATTNDIIYFEGDKRTRFNGRAEMTQGADVASVAGAIALGYDGNTFEITGTNAITLISNLGWQNGTEVTLIFTSTATLTDGTANSGTDIGMELEGNTNFVGSADDIIKLTLCEMGGTQRWRQSGKSVN